MTIFLSNEIVTAKKSGKNPDFFVDFLYILRYYVYTLINSAQRRIAMSLSSIEEKYFASIEEGMTIPANQDFDEVLEEESILMSNGKK